MDDRIVRHAENVLRRVDEGVDGDEILLGHVGLSFGALPPVSTRTEAGR